MRKFEWDNASSPALSEMLQEVVQAEEKWHQMEIPIHIKAWRAPEIVNMWVTRKDIFASCKLLFKNRLFKAMRYRDYNIYTHMYVYMCVHAHSLSRSVWKVSSHALWKIETFTEDTRYNKHCT